MLNCSFTGFLKYSVTSVSFLLSTIGTAFADDILVWDSGNWDNQKWAYTLLNFDGDIEPNDTDVFPLDSTEWLDTDGDGIGNNADWDDDGDDVPDVVDEAPLDKNNTNEIPLPLDGVYKGVLIRQSMIVN